MSTVHRSANTTGAYPRAGDPTDPEAIVRVVFEKSPLLVYITDLDFKIVLFNRALRETTGYDTSDCGNVDALLRRFYPDEKYRSVVEAIHQGFVRNEHIRDAELVATTKDGAQRTISWSTSRLRIGRGPTVGYIALGVDVTTRRNLQQWVSIFQTSLRHLQEGVVMTEPSGRVLAWSEGARRVLGYADDEMAGRPLGDLYMSAEREIIARTVDRAIESEGRYSGEVELEHKDGKNRILVFDQFRIDGDGGLPLARLTLLREPGSEEPGRAAELSKEASDLRGRLEDVQAVLKERDAVMEALQANGAGAEERAGEATAALAAATQRAELAEARVQELEQEAASHATSTAERMAAVEGAVEQAAEDVKQSHAELETARAEADAARQAAEAAHLAAEAAQMAAEEEAEGLRAELEALKTQLEEAQAAAAETAGTAEVAAAAEVEKANQQVEALKLQLEALEDAADVARQESEAAAAAAQAKAAEEHAAALAEANASVTAAQESLDAANARNAELAAQVEELKAEAAKGADEGTRATALESELAAARTALEEAQEGWVQERSQLEDGHRKALDAQQERAKAQRTELEEQLSRDILAAEERAEAERDKLTKQHDLERSNLTDAVAIARAEAESEFKDQVEQLRAQVERSGQLQPHLTPIESSALIAADTEGKIIGWSGGAALLDGRTQADALGATIHQDVLRLEGVEWKALFGKVVVEGVVEQEVTLLASNGEPREVLLKAAIVKDAGGKLLGVTEVLVAPELQGDPSLHGQAAFGRLALPLHQALEARALAGLDNQRRTGAAVQDLSRLGNAVADEGGWADVLAAARSIALPELMEALPGLVRASEDSWMDLRATAQDLGRLGALVDSPDDTDVHWNDLVGRCLYAVLARGGVGAIERDFGDGGVVRVRSDRLLPLLLLLLEPLGAGADATIRSRIEDGRARLEVEGAVPQRDALGVARALARDVGGQVRLDGGAVRLDLPVEPTTSAAVPEVALEADGERTELISGDVLAAVAASSELSDIVDLGPEVEELVVESEEEEAAAPASEDPTDDGVEEVQAAPPTKPPKGSVEFLEEGEHGDLLLAAGEDSIVASLADIAPDLIDGGSGAPSVDTLEEVFLDGDVGVSPALLAQAAEMDAYAEKRGGNDQLESSGARKASKELMAEMSETDTALDKAARGAAAKKSAPAKKTEGATQPAAKKPAPKGRSRRSRKSRKK